MTTGMNYVEKEFGKTPTVGWQIDPFGNNHFTASLYSSLGFDS